MYRPYSNQRIILDRGFELLRSVPYQVSVRWLFYRLLQEGFYRKKDDYKLFLKLTSRARHNFYADWTPDILTDDSREVIDGRHGDYENVAMVTFSLRKGFDVRLDHWFGQKNYCEIWYEARAMSDQFKYYTKEITLRPFGGDPSIPYKWQAAKDIEACSEKYGKPVVILYFGDFDKRGKSIGVTAERDIRKWCETDFSFIRCGLTKQQVKRYGVPENPWKPGEYQWEALDDVAASEIIGGFFDRYVSAEIIERRLGDSLKLEREVKSLMVLAAGKLEKKYEGKI